MSKYIVLVLIMVSSVVLAERAVFAESGSVLVTNVPTMLLPSRQLSSAPAWVTNSTFAQGSYCQNTNNGFIYWAEVGGTGKVANTPPTSVTNEVDGSTTWRKCNKLPRNGLCISNIGTYTNFISIGKDTEIDKGIVLLPNTSWYDDSGIIQDAIYGIGVITNRLLTLEW